jgi:hypothetical protein
MAKYQIEANDLIRYVVVVEAENEEEALHKFRDGDCESEHEIERYWYGDGTDAVLLDED